MYCQAICNTMIISTMLRSSNAQRFQGPPNEPAGATRARSRARSAPLHCTAPSLERSMQTLRRALILTHRYLGIPLSVLFVLWFVTGIAMIYVGGMPTLSAQARLERLACARRRGRALHAGRSGRTSGERLRPRRVDDGARSTRVSVREPVRRGDRVRRYRRGARRDRRRHRARRRREVRRRAGERRRARCARSSVPINGRCSSAAICRCYKFAVRRRRRHRGLRFAEHGRSAARHDDEDAHAGVDRDDPALVLHHAAAHESAALVLDRRRRPRRSGCLLALLGLVLGVTQFNKSKPFRWSNAVRYQGWMRWHYISRRILRRLRADVGVQRPACRWSRSTGRTPTKPRDSRRRADGRPRRARAIPCVRRGSRGRALLAGRTLKELEFRRIDDAPYYLARYTGHAAEPDPRRERLHQPYPITGRAEPQHMLVDARTLAERTAAVRDGHAACAPRARPRPTRRSSRTSCSTTTTRITTRATARRRCRCCA